MNKKSISFLIATMLSAFCASAQEALVLDGLRSEFDRSYEEYKELSLEYLENLDLSMRTALRIRQKDMSEEFRIKIKELESSMRQQNKKDTGFVDQYLAQAKSKVYLDDGLLMQICLLHFKKANFEMEEAMSKYHKNLEAYYRKEIAKAPAMPVANYERTFYYAKKLLKEYPYSELSSYALYLVGSIHEEMAEFDLAMKDYAKHLQSYPYSKHRVEVMWRYAELLADAGDEKMALNLYNKITKSNEIELQIKAQYKILAINYKNKNFKQVLKDLKVFDDSLTKNESKNLQLFSSLRAEFYEYLGLLYLQGIDISSFKQKQRLEALNSVSARLERHNQRQESLALFGNAIKSNYFSEEVPSYYSSLIRISEENGDLVSSVKYNQQMQSHISKKSEWWKKNREKRVRYEAEEALERSSLFLARHYAERATEEKSKKLYSLAEIEYKKFLDLNPPNSLLSVSYFELGQIEQNLANYDSALENYKKALGLGLSGEDLNLAAYQIFFLNVQKEKHQLKPFNRESLLTKKDLTNSDKNLLDSFSYISRYLDVESRYDIQAYVAQIYAVNGYLEEAKSLLEGLLFSSSISEKSFSKIENNVRSLQEIYSVEKNWDGIQKLNEKLASSKIPSDKLQSSGIKAFKNSRLLEAREAESKGDIDLAKSLYLNFIKEFVKDSEKDDASIALANLYRKQYNFKESNAILDKVANKSRTEDYSVLYMKNLIDGLHINKALSYFESLPKKSRSLARLDSLYRYAKYLQIKTDSDPYYLAYQETKNVALAIQSVKLQISEGHLDVAKSRMEDLSGIKNKDYALALKGLSALVAMRNSDWNLAKAECSRFVSNYSKVKQTNTSTQSLYFQCDLLQSLEVGMDSKSIQERLELYHQQKDYDVLQFAKILFKIKNPSLSIASIDQWLAESTSESVFQNWLSEVEGDRKYSIEKDYWAIFPFHIFRADDLKESYPGSVSFESMCDSTGTVDCYKKVYKEFSKTKSREWIDDLVYLSILMDNDSLIQRWLKLAVKENKVSADYAKHLLNPNYADLVVRLNDGNAKEQDYYSLAAYLGKESELHKAKYVLNQAVDRFSSNPLVLKSAQLLLDKQSDGFNSAISVGVDPRMQYLEALYSLKGNSNSSRSKWSLLSSTEWEKSLRISYSIWNGSKLAEVGKLKSAYNLGLLAINNLQSGDVEVAVKQWKKAKKLGAQFGDTYDFGSKREVANE